MAATEASDQQIAKADEQSGEKPQDQAGAGESGVEEVEEGVEAAGEEGTEEEEGEEEPEGLISDEEFEKLKGDPAKLRGQLQKSYTQKTQRLSRERRELAPWRNLITALEENPADTVSELARQFGIEVVKPKGQEEVTETVATKVTAALRKALGDEYGDLADKLGAAIHDAADMVVSERIKETQGRISEMEGDVALQESNRVLAAFSQEFPEWKKHESAMVKLSAQMPPGPNTDQMDYLRNL